MAYDEDLASRVRRRLAGTDAEEKRMFGGLAFMVNTHMGCAVLGKDLMVRVDPDAYEQALEQGALETTRFSGRPMRGFVIVPGSDVDGDEELAEWVGRGVAWAQGQPPKVPKPKAARKR